VCQSGQSKTLVKDARGRDRNSGRHAAENAAEQLAEISRLSALCGEGGQKERSVKGTGTPPPCG
jgi:hypothetical protein